MTEVIFLGLGLGMLVIGILSVIIAGVRSFALGNSDLKKTLVMLTPALVFGVSYAATGSATEGGIATMVVMLVCMIAAIAFTGLRGTLKF